MSLQSITIGGRHGTVVYLNDNWEEVPEARATMARTLFEDGSSAFYQVTQRRAARRRRPETAVHAAGDAHFARMKVAVDYAFATARAAIRGMAGRQPKEIADAAAKAVKKALGEVLPKQIRAVMAAGGNAAVVMLKDRAVRIAEFDPDQPRDESGRWTSSGGFLTRDGKRVEAFHGTPQEDLTVADLDPGAAIEVGGATFFTTDEDTAWQYTFEREYGEIVGESSENVLRAQFRMENPMVVDMAGEVGEAIKLGQLVREAKEKGYDGLILENIDDTVDSSAGPNSNHVTIAVFKKGQAVPSRGQMALLAAPKLKMRFDAASPEAVAWADRHAAELIDGISETTREDINNAIAEALEHGDLRDAYDEILAAVGSSDRAELIARTEIMTAAHEGQRQAWDQAVDAGLLPKDARRMWVATGDESVCPICEQLDGEIADLDGEYSDPGGDGPPAHPNCRCTEGIV